MKTKKEIKAKIKELLEYEAYMRTTAENSGSENDKRLFTAAAIFAKEQAEVLLWVLD